MMLERTKYLGDMIMMLKSIFKEIISFFGTFGIIIIIYLIIGKILGNVLVYEIENSEYWPMF